MSKISDLVELLAADANDNDLLYIVDTSEGTTGSKKITLASLKSAVIPSASVIPYDNTASGLAASFVKTAVDELQTSKEPAFSKNTAFNKNFGTTTGTVVQGDDLRLSMRNVVVVQKTPGDGQFSTVEAALASITDASAINPYVIKIGPGIFTENPLTLKPHVHLSGSGKLPTILASNNPLVNFIEAAGSTTISDLSLTGASGIGSALIHFTSVDNTDTALTLDTVDFLNFNKAVSVEAGSFSAAVDMTNVTLFNQFEASRVFECIGNSTGVCNLNISNARSVFLQDVDHLFHIEGPNAVFSGSNLLFGSNGSGHFLHVQDGSDTTMQDTVGANFDIGIHFPNTGAGSKVNFGGELRSITYDIFIEHPSAEGFFIGAADNEKVTIDPGGNFRVSFTDPINSGSIGQVIVGDIRQANRYDRLANITKLLREGTTIGVIEGGVISIDSGFDIDVTGGSGFLIDQTDNFVKEISWTADNLTIPANSIRYIYVDTNSVVQQSASPQNLTFTLPLGRVSTDSSGVRTVEAVDMDMVHLGNNIEQYLRNLGPIFSFGSTVSENGTRQLDVTAGQYNYGINELSLSAATTISWTANYRNGSGGWTEVSQSTVDNAQYDDGSGTLAAIPSGEYAKHVLYAIGGAGNEKYFLVYSQDTYVDQPTAAAADLPTTPPWISEAVVRVAGIIIQEGTTNIVDIIDLRPRIGFAAPSSSGTSLHSGLLGLLVDDHPQYLLVDGTRSMAGNLNMAGNNITSVGTVNSVTVEAHASRHLPNGADPLTTAAPIAISDSTNSIGTANSFARSDHVHSHGDRTGGTLHSAVTTLANGFMIASDKLKLDGIESGATADQVAADVPFTPVGSIAASDVQAAIAEVDSEKQAISEKSQANGYASLDGSGKVPISELPDTVVGSVEYKGTWNANTNTPDLPALTPDKGDYYVISVAGSTDLDGITDWQIGDWAIYNGTAWEKIDNTDQVSSVFGRQGTVIAADGDYTGNQIVYNGTAGLTATRTGPAIDETVGRLVAAETLLNTHASRHLPSGADALATAAPSSNLNGNSTNAVGSANSLARSDHSHNIDDATTSVGGLMSSVDKEKLDNIPLQRYFFGSDQLENPVTADWAINALAAAVPDTVNSGITVRRFDDTIEEGVGMTVYIPPTATTMTITFLNRAQSAPVSANTVGLRLYRRSLSTTVGAWNAGVDLTDVGIDSDTNWNLDLQTDTLANWGLSADQVYQLELTRIDPSAGTELVGDWVMQYLQIEFN